jgi:hypothetical protein
MAEIISFEYLKTGHRQNQCFRSWRDHFNEDINSQSLLTDLSDGVLYRLATPGERSNTLFYKLILCLLGYNQNTDLTFLDKTIQIDLIDIHMFLCDLIRFEIMRRLGWLSELPICRFPVVELITDYKQKKEFFNHWPPELSHQHPKYPEYQWLVEGDRQVFIRRLFADALKAFDAGNSPI